MQTNETKKANSLKAFLEEMEVQINLGKKEAEDRFEEARKKFKSFWQEEELQGIKKLTEELSPKLQEALDELKVQTELGKMEARDRFNEQRKKLNAALDELSDKYLEARKEGDERYDKMVDKLDEEIAKLRSKTDTFWVHLNLGKADAEDEFEARRKELKAKLHEIKNKWNEVLDKGEGNLDDLSKELKKVFADYGDF